MAAFITDKTNPEITPDLSKLISLLDNINRLLNEKIQQKQELEGDFGQLDAENVNVTSNLGQEGGNRFPKNAAIQSREDVVRAIDAICKYFERYEPSSPVPFLLLRAKRLLSMNFMEILGELTPDALRQAEEICGKQSKQ
jgi:type VI secretion system protein ImpA